jgi:hypothetical protein
MCTVITVIFWVCNSVKQLQLLVVTIQKWSVIQYSNQNPRRESLIHVTIWFSYLFSTAINNHSRYVVSSDGPNIVMSDALRAVS